MSKGMRYGLLAGLAVLALAGAALFYIVTVRFPEIDQWEQQGVECESAGGSYEFSRFTQEWICR